MVFSIRHLVHHLLLYPKQKSLRETLGHYVVNPLAASLHLIPTPERRDVPLETLKYLY